MAPQHPKGGDFVDSTSDRVDAYLEHFGVKGMKWGVRRASTSASKPPASEDATRAAMAKTKLKAGGTKALSTKELQDLVTRMNLEQQFARLQPPSKTKQALGFVSDVLVSVGKQQVTKLATDQAAKLVEKALKSAVK